MWDDACLICGMLCAPKSSDLVTVTNENKIYFGGSADSGFVTLGRKEIPINRSTWYMDGGVVYGFVAHRDCYFVLLKYLGRKLSLFEVGPMMGKLGCLMDNKRIYGASAQKFVGMQLASEQQSAIQKAGMSWLLESPRDNTKNRNRIIAGWRNTRTWVGPGPFEDPKTFKGHTLRREKITKLRGNDGNMWMLRSGKWVPA